MEDDVIERLRSSMGALEGEPVNTHVQALTTVLDTIVGELDDLARTIPPAR